MPKALKVYGMTWCGKSRRIVAASSYAEAAEKFGITVYQLRPMCAVTGNVAENDLARKHPGIVFERGLHSQAQWRML